MSSLLIRTEQNPVLTHLNIDPFKGEFQYSPSLTNIVKSLLTNIFKSFAQGFPLIAAASPILAAPLRILPDFFSCATNPSAEKMAKGALSAFSIYAFLFAPDQFKVLEAGRAFWAHSKEIYNAYQNNERIEGVRAFLHLMVDAVNLTLIRYNSLELRFLSHSLQLLAGALDLKKAWTNRSYLEMGVHGGLSILRAMNAVSTGKELYAAFQPASISLAPIPLEQDPIPSKDPAPSTPNLAQNLCSAIDIPQAAVLFEKGTGSAELGSLTVLQYLGADSFSGESFLVKDVDGKTKVLKRLFTQSERMAKLGISHLFTSPIQLITAMAGNDSRTREVSQALAISQVGDPNIIQVFKAIQNVYSKEIMQKSGEKVVQEVNDIYLLMEHFDGISLDQLKSVSLENLTYLKTIASTLSRVANLKKYFYISSTHKIKVMGENLKFVDPASFNDMTYASGWTNCISAYRSMYVFFVDLTMLLPDREKWLAQLEGIFNHLNLVLDYYNTPIDAPAGVKAALEARCKVIFNIDLLKITLAKVQALFSSAS